jgi:phenylpyruvate tautomerase PptA (4-oxalocrotonate tautomerase family)
MPLWNVYCTEGTYSTEDKRAFAEAITDIYAGEAGGLPELVLPRFYVVVVFHDLPRDSVFIGGVPRNDFVRFSIDHIAVSMPAELRELLLKFINKSIHPFVRDRGLDWEIHIDDTPRDQWKIQGMRPPDTGSEEEQRWRRENRPSKPPQNVAANT